VAIRIQHSISSDLDTSFNLVQQRRALIRLPLRQAYPRNRI
jgi:hypothetical protein